jgi:type IV pilus assembly protein PilV
MKLLKAQSGATLIEIAITVLILATSLLAMATLQTRSLQYNQAAFMRSQANIHAYDITDRIRINRGAASINIEKYSADYDATPSGNALAVTDVSEWRANIVRSLPGGKGKIACVLATRVCKVSIKWSDEQIFGAEATSNPEATSEFIYSTAI